MKLNSKQKHELYFFIKTLKNTFKDCQRYLNKNFVNKRTPSERDAFIANMKVIWETMAALQTLARIDCGVEFSFFRTGTNNKLYLVECSKQDDIIKAVRRFDCGFAKQYYAYRFLEKKNCLQ